MPGSAGMATPCVLLALLFKTMCFKSTLHMTGAIADEGFFSVVGILEHVGHFWFRLGSSSLIIGVVVG